MIPLRALLVSALQIVLFLSLLSSAEARTPRPQAGYLKAELQTPTPGMKAELQTGAGQLVLRGRVVCRETGLGPAGGHKKDAGKPDTDDLERTGAIASVTDEPGPKGSRHRADYIKPCGQYALDGSDGKSYTFNPSDPMVGMFSDTRVRGRDLQITASPRSDSQLEILRVQSLRNGRLYDLYYFCDICNITAYSPGPCPCCRRDLELKEVPASEP